jgi:sentrin-specific protease 1
LARYISDEAQHKRSTALDVSEWQRSAPTDIPEQKNGCDCGVFMLKYADWLVRLPRRAVHHISVRCCLSRR